MMADQHSWEELKMRLQKMFKGTKKTTWLLIVGLAGIVLIGLSSLKKNDPIREETVISQTAQYTADLEARLEEMVSSIYGAGHTKVTVMLENGVEYVYANEEKRNSDHSQNDRGDISNSDDNHRTVVTVDDGSGKNGLLVTEIQPKVRGVVVACEGGSDAVTCALVKEAVTTALDITDKHVCVIPHTTKGGANG